MQDYRQIVSSGQRDVEQATESYVEQTNGLFKYLEAGLLAVEHWISNNPERIPWQDPELLQLVQGLRRASGGRVDIRLVSRQGQLYHLPPVGLPFDVSDREYYRCQIENPSTGFYLAAPVVSRVTGKWSIPVSLAVREAASRVAVVHGVIELDDFSQLFERQRPKPDGVLGLVRSDGVLLAQLPPLTGLLGKNLDETPEFLDHFNTQPRGVFLRNQGFCGPGTWIVAYSRLESFPVTAFLAVPLSETLRPWRREFCVFVLLSLAVSLVTSGVVVRLCRVMDANALVHNELRVLATYDSLTGLHNRQAFLDQAGREAALARRGLRTFSVVLVDVDGFKKINDTHGHAAGDEVLRRLGTLFRQVCREADLAGRLGGEEFAIVLAGTGLGDAVLVAERLRKQCQSLDLRFTTGLAPVTISAGVVEFSPDDDVHIENTIQRADAYLYAAKRNGRNRVESPLGGVGE